MAHELEITAPGEASFAYRAAGGAPWHKLGKAIDGHMTASEVLSASNADYEVVMQPCLTGHPNRTIDGNHALIEVPGRYVTGRVEADQHGEPGDFVPWEVVKGRYQIVQNSVVLDKALAVVGASNGDAVMDTAGVLNDGRKFFATIDLGQVIVDPAGVRDIICRYLVVSTSHDGTSPIVYSNTDIRAVCANTVRMGKMHAASIFTARHTTNVVDRLDEAGKVLGISSDWSKAFAKEAEFLMSIEMPSYSNRIDKVLNVVWPEKDADTDRKRVNREEIMVSVRSRFGSRRNAAGFGDNGWSLMNAIGEHLDHGRNVPPEQAAQQSMELANLVHRHKIKAHRAIHNLAR